MNWFNSSQNNKKWVIKQIKAKRNINKYNFKMKKRSKNWNNLCKIYHKQEINQMINQKPNKSSINGIPVLAPALASRT